MYSLVGSASAMRQLVLDRLLHPYDRAGARDRRYELVGQGLPIQPIFPAQGSARLELGLAALADNNPSEAERVFNLVIQPDAFDVLLMTPVARARAAAATKRGDVETATRALARAAWLSRDAEPASAGASIASAASLPVLETTAVRPH